MRHRSAVLFCLAAALCFGQRSSGGRGMNTSRPSKAGGARTVKEGSGKIQVETELKDTSVFIDERLTGKAGKKKFSAAAGGHSVELKDSQGRSCKQNVLVTAGATAIVNCTPASPDGSPK